ncbi:MAG: hypothetical protein KC615_23540 [Anaerolineae bacterium]|nr:hypothetical protein [Anaerolineae bacterium]
MDIFDGIDDIPWKKHGMEDAPYYIRDLISEDEKKRDIAYDQLLDNYVYENFAFSYHLVWYMIKIMQSGNLSADIALYLGFFHNLYRTAEPKRKFSKVDRRVAQISSELVDLIASNIGGYNELANHVDEEICEAARLLVVTIEESHQE